MNNRMTQFVDRGRLARLLAALLVGLTCVALSGGFTPVYAQGLSISKKRIVLEDRARHARVNLLNRSDQTAVYRIQFIQMRMKQDGTLSEIDKSDKREGEKFVDKYVRFSPRQVKLEPGESQIVRLLVRKPSDLPDGEYRSHLQLKSVTPSRPSQSEKPDGTDTSKKSMNVSVNMRVSFTIPVIVRHGSLSADLSMSDLKLVRDKKHPRLQMTLDRTGNRSVYANFDIEYHPPGDDQKPVQLVSDMLQAAYSPLSTRQVSLPIRDIPDKVDLSRGRLVVKLRESPQTKRSKSPESLIRDEAELELSSSSEPPSAE